ncbi:hypothetical protein AURDEDRAFT_183717 [Auricularia subglabra TFB-10046 SS5]|nr:hypothetical protein AURDEDRAFT_183717 [Auricularia subglabra TFB-10046 SS5]
MIVRVVGRVLLPLALATVAHTLGIDISLSLFCVEFTSTIAAQATNVAGISLNSTGNGEPLRVAGSFDIAFRFCRPPPFLGRHSSTLQILGHGASYTSAYWSFPYRPALYSYEARAVAAGFSTLSYDLLGAGKSEMADPFNEVQIPMNIVIATAIVQAAKAGTLARRRHGVPAFKRVVYVAHSMGSLILNGVLTASPHLVDAAVLTGYSHMPTRIPTLADGDIQIAARTFPSRFGHLSPGYTVIQDRSMFYGPNDTFDPRVLEKDITTQNVVSVGDAYTLPFGVHPAPDFRGHVFVLAGEFDAGNCTPNCSNIPHEHIYYPKAASFAWHVVPRTGHVLNLHYSAPHTFSLILEWISSKGF